MTVSWKHIVLGIGIVLIDLAVYLVFGLLLMGYDDFYDETKGEYWSLESMNFWQKVNYIGLNLWHLINLILIGYVIYWIIKEIGKRERHKTTAI